MSREQEAKNLYVETINGLHETWTPHDGQVAIGRALFKDQFMDIFCQCGRNFGKTDFVAYALWRWAKTNPGSENYYFAPYMKQAREILWASHRVQNFGKREWMAGDPNNTEMRITLTNGSFIKLDGSDNVDAYRGIKPRGLIVLDEFKDFRPEFYEAFDPNRAAHNAPMIIIGTPPDRDCQFLKVAAEYRKNPAKRFFKFPTSTNPHLSKDWLESKRVELVTRGEEDVWQREYLAEFVPGGVSKIFPMLDRAKHVFPRGTLINEIQKDLRKLEWYVMTDPGAATCFAVLFAALNPYTKTWYFFDEIYETNQAAMSVSQIGSRIIAGKRLLNRGGDWFQGYDEAETWFANEMLDNFDEHFAPTHKQKKENEKESGLSLLRDALLRGKVKISDSCEKLFWELDNYYKDKNGKIPKSNDHLIDCVRYTFGAAAYCLAPQKEYKEHEDENFRAAKISDDFPGLDEWGDKASNEDFGGGPLWSE